MESPLKQAFEYFLAHREELLRKYNGRVIVIKNGEVLGDYPDEGTAVSETQQHHQLGTFLVQKVEPDSSSFTQTFHSRVAFALT